METDVIKENVSVYLEVKNNTIKIEVSDEGQGLILILLHTILRNWNAVEEGLLLLMVCQMKYISIKIE